MGWFGHGSAQFLIEKGHENGVGLAVLPHIFGCFLWLEYLRRKRGMKNTTARYSNTWRTWPGHQIFPKRDHTKSPGSANIADA